MVFKMVFVEILKSPLPKLKILQKVVASCPKVLLKKVSRLTLVI